MLEDFDRYSGKTVSMGHLVIADIDGNGSVEILARAERKAFVLDSNLDVASGWPVDVPWARSAFITPVDLDADGKMEILVGGDHELHAFATDGSAVAGFPIQPEGYSSQSVTVAYLKSHAGPALIYRGSDAALYAVDSGGRTLGGFPIILPYSTAAGAPTVQDVDKDGTLDIAIITKHRELMIFEQKASKTTSSWMMARGNVGRTGEAATARKPIPSTWRRTAVLVYGETVPGQDMYVRGGIDHDYAKRVLGIDCTQENRRCSIPIRHLVLNDLADRQNDRYLDWHGSELGQGNVEGSPLAWTTNHWPAHWGQKRTVEREGFGETPMNRWGHHYWLLYVNMDCSKTVNGWFELKSYISNGPGWERDVKQSDTPYASRNHMARCGYLNVFRRGQNEAVTIESLAN